MSNLLAYIPTVNQRHLDWFSRHPDSCLFVITQKMAESFLPRLARNMAAVPTDIVVKMIKSTGSVSSVDVFDPKNWNPRLVKPDATFGPHGWQDWILPDEDISDAVAEKYLSPFGCKCQMEEIWARWDMKAVKKAQLIVPDAIVSSDILDIVRMKILDRIARKSPDWWRQIAAAAWKDDICLASAFNTHMPNEYETYIFGDPRLNVDAGQKGVYVSLHAERGVIARCARKGIRLDGASMYVSTFPCEDCAREIREAGIRRLLFGEGYSVLDAQEILRTGGVEIVQVVKEPGAA